jgi:hypothetical protein
MWKIIQPEAVTAQVSVSSVIEGAVTLQVSISSVIEGAVTVQVSISVLIVNILMKFKGYYNLGLKYDTR